MDVSLGSTLGPFLFIVNLNDRPYLMNTTLFLKLMDIFTDAIIKMFTDQWYKTNYVKFVLPNISVLYEQS